MSEAPRRERKSSTASPGPNTRAESRMGRGIGGEENNKLSLICKTDTLEFTTQVLDAIIPEWLKQDSENKHHFCISMKIMYLNGHAQKGRWTWLTLLEKTQSARKYFNRGFRYDPWNWMTRLNLFKTPCSSGLELTTDLMCLLSGINVYKYLWNYSTDPVANRLEMSNHVQLEIKSAQICRKFPVGKSAWLSLHWLKGKRLNEKDVWVREIW